MGEGSTDSRTFIQHQDPPISRFLQKEENSKTIRDSTIPGFLWDRHQFESAGNEDEGEGVEHKAFGQVVTALRKEQIDFASGHSWSQRQLAEETGLTVRIVGKIERGEQARLDGAILQGLAQAFQLTSFRATRVLRDGERGDGRVARARRSRQRGCFCAGLGVVGHVCARRRS